MLTSRSSFSTKKAHRYLQQMCKHFSHKVTVSFDLQQGHVEFPLGQADLTAHVDRLNFLVRSETAEGLESCKNIIEDHITRFAFREGLEMLNWSD